MRWPDELTESPDLQGAYPRLSDVRMRTLAAHGERRPAHRDDVLFAEGDPCAAFFVVLSGKVATVKGYGADDHVIRVHGAGRFLGELNVLTGQASFITAVEAEDGEVLAVPVDELRRLVAGDEILGDLVLRAYLIRRSMLIGLGAGFRIMGSRYSPACRRLREFAARNRLPHQWIDLEQDAEVERFLRRTDVTPAETPVVIWRGELVLRNPTNAELARAIGLPAPSTREAMCSAGQAALFLARHVASVRLLVREGELTRNMSRYLAVEIEQHPGIQVMPNTQVRRLAG
ncbi:cyclic nucleotide-binding domain-containing protein [Microbispora rosea]|uniref:cyclic nucleotide-binding domain-containing protein n=1 Tax=Microbispora rosea TaxID=58117 RepID=UPI003699A66C